MCRHKWDNGDGSVCPKIFTFTHKSFTPPPDPMYVPVQVGAAIHEDLGYQRDDDGENISALNPYYAELSGLYWVWKNVKDTKIVGTAHYRRFLINKNEELLTAEEIEDILSDFDIITTKRLDLNFSYEFGFTKNHTALDLQVANAAVEKLYPDFYPLYRQLLAQKHTYFGNMMICRKVLYDEYCEFLFPIFGEMHGKIDLDSYDPYHRRLYGFISEFILYAWCVYKNLAVYGCKVGMVGEKKETTEAAEYMWKLFDESRIEEAKAYFLEVHRVRPDILMEAADIHNYLHLNMQVISTCEFEIKEYGKILLPLQRLHGRRLMKYMADLNDKVRQGMEDEPLRRLGYSNVAIRIARMIQPER